MILNSVSKLRLRSRLSWARYPRTVNYTIIAFCLALGTMLVFQNPATRPAPQQRHVISLKQSPSFDSLGHQFSDSDLANYRQAYSLQKQADWDGADEAFANLTDDALLGSLLANRYLHPKYESSYDELVMWLENYADMPDAQRIYALARNKKPAKVRLDDYEIQQTRLGGIGTRDGLNSSATPAGWQNGLDAWIDGAYERAGSEFSRAASNAKTNWHRSAGHFWAYRSYMQTGNRALAGFHLRQAGESPYTLYGSLARQLMGSSSLSQDWATIHDDIRFTPAVKRAAAFRALDRTADADLELRHAFTRADYEQKKQLVRIAAELDLPSLQLRMSQMLDEKRSLTNTAAYPMPRWLSAANIQTDPALLYAIVRQESAFDTDARSPAGARGVMQLMPKTASYMIRSFKLDEVQLAALDTSDITINTISVDKLDDPAVNMMVGQQYVKYLQDKSYINSNLIYLLAAYNAGPAHLIDWSKRFGDVEDPLLFIELIPFRETRHYVTQVLTNYMIYGELMSGQQDTAEALAAGHWPLLHSDVGTYSATYANLR